MNIINRDPDAKRGGTKNQHGIETGGSRYVMAKLSCELLKSTFALALQFGPSPCRALNHVLATAFSWIQKPCLLPPPPTPARTLTLR